MPNVKFDWPRALGEFLIIVIGVLCAFAVDEWRLEREDRKSEAAYLARIRADIEQDVTTFTQEIVIHEKKVHFLQSLLDKTVERQFREDPRALMAGKVYSSFKGLPDSVSTSFDELRSTGGLALIEDVGVRRAMSQYYSGYETLAMQVDTFPYGEYAPLIYGVVPGSIAREWRLSDTISRPEEFLRSMLELQEHPDLRVAANTEITYATAMQFYLTQYLDRAKDLLRLLEES